MTQTKIRSRRDGGVGRRTLGRAISFAAASTLLAFAAPLQAQDAPGRAEAGDRGIQEAPAESAQAAGSKFEALLAAELGHASGLTSDQVARRAESTSFDVRARQAELLAAAAAVDESLAAWYPRVTLSARYTRLSDESRSGDAANIVAAPGSPAGPLAPGAQLANVPLEFESPRNQYAFQASLSVPVSDYFLTIGQRERAARHGERAAAFSERAHRQRAAADGKLAYYGWVRAKLDTVVSEQALIVARAQRDDVRAAEQAGSATLADVLSVDARVAETELLLSRSQSLARIAEQRLRTMMHVHSGNLLIGEDVRKELGIPSGGVESLLGEARRRRPELLALSARAASYGEQASAARGSTLPRLALFANAYYANPNQRAMPQTEAWSSSWDAGASLSWTLNEIPAGSASARGHEARRESMEAERRSLEDSIRMQIEEAREQIEQAKRATDTSARRLVSAEEGYRVRRALFQVGRAKSTELSDAAIELTRAQLDVIAARIDQRTARIQLLYAIGRKV
jgi:outer membrane protein TolC